jgi:hypothetical protein
VDVKYGEAKRKTNEAVYYRDEVELKEKIEKMRK